MAAPRTKTIQQIDDDELENGKELETNLVNNEVDDLVDDAETELRNVLADLGGSNDAKINVYKMDNGKRAFVGAFTPSDFSLETIQINYGGGDYDIQVRISGRFLKRKMVTIAKPLVTSSAPGQIGQHEIIATMMKGFETMNQNLANALSGLNQNKTTLDTLNELKLMKDIFGGGENSRNNDDLSTFLKGIEFAKQTLPREGESNFTDLAIEAVKSLAPAFQQQNPPAIPPQMPRAPVAVRPPQTSAPIQPVENVNPANPENINQIENNESENMNPLLKMYLNTLVSHAEKDHDPALYAEVVLDTVGDEAALGFVDRGDWYELLCAAHPRVSEFRQWFTDLRAAILTLTAPDEPANNADIDNSGAENADS